MREVSVIRVLVVDDSAFMRKALSSMLGKANGIEVVGIAHNGVDAVHQAEKLKPDVVTLDIEMPQMDGLTALKQIKRVCDAAVLMVSSLTTEGSTATLRALKLGASDFIAKDQSQISTKVLSLETELVSKVKAVARCSRVAPPVHAPIQQSIVKAQPGSFDLLVIGSSTGGPPVLETILTALPAGYPVPVVVAQHMPRMFTETMSQRLDQVCHVGVRHVEHGMPAEPGHAYISPGGLHTRVRRSAMGLRFEVSPEPTHLPYKPSVDELFSSACRAYSGRVLAAVLTGMGDDGLIGARQLAEAGATIIAQDHESCVVYGMPKAVTQAGLVSAMLNPEGLAAYLCEAGGVAAAA